MFTRAGQWENALDIFDRVFTTHGQTQMRSSPTALQADEKTYQAAIEACAKGRQWERAFQLFDEFKTSGVASNGLTYE